MSALVFDFVPIWTLILGVGVFLYVLLDGFDLGVGILYGFAPDRDARNLVMNSVAPIWDGNETWLVLGGSRCSRRFRWLSPSSCRRSISRC
jgi:cytochrome bd ubiquinol oxidase subunit II